MGTLLYHVPTNSQRGKYKDLLYILKQQVQYDLHCLFQKKIKFFCGAYK